MTIPSWFFIVAVLGVIVAWAAMTTAQMLAAFAQAPPAGTPEGIIGRGAILGTITMFGLVIIVLSASAAVYVYRRQPVLPGLQGLAVQPVFPERHPAQVCMTHWTAGMPVAISTSQRVPWFEPTDMARPSDKIKEYVAQDSKFRLSGGPLVYRGECWWLVETGKLRENGNWDNGWLPDRYEGQPVLRSQN